MPIACKLQSYCTVSYHLLSHQQFQILLTFFPKFFSQFPHGTYTLSSSNIYLASSELYHLLCIPIPKNAIFKSMLCMKACAWHTRVSPSLQHFPTCLTYTLPIALLFKNTSLHMKCRLPMELILLHSPLPKESFIVCFPPLTYMLKFNEFIYLHHKQKESGHAECTNRWKDFQTAAMHQAVPGSSEDKHQCTISTSNACAQHLTHVEDMLARETPTA